MADRVGVNKESSIYFIPVILLMAAIFFHLPYGYYTFLRVIVFGFSCLSAYRSFARDQQLNVITVVSLVVAVLFNPFVPVYLTRDVWRIADVVTALWFLYLFFAGRRIGLGKS